MSEWIKDKDRAAAVPDRVRGGVHEKRAHDSAHKHVAGAAAYVDDMPEPARTLQVFIAMSSLAHARIRRMELARVRAAPGVVCALTAADVPGANDVSPIGKGDEPVFADSLVEYAGQSLFAVAAETVSQARAAAALAEIDYDELEPVLDVDTARARESYVMPPSSMARGDAAEAIRKAPKRLKGRVRIGGQDHFYLEGQISLAVPGEDGDVLLYSSTQHPSEIQHVTARVLGLRDHAVTVEVRRMGGAFGGKETQGNLFAAVAALVATRTGRPAKVRLDRDDDMVMTGKRHDFAVDYEVGFDAEGRIHGVRFDFASRCGYSADLSQPINDRALFHADNCYHYPAVLLRAYPCKTNTVSNTAFRGFGGPQGMVACERVIEEVAFATGQDPLAVRKLNMYGTEERNVTPYHMTIEDNVAPEIVAKLEADADYADRRARIHAANAASPWLKKGIALTPVKFGVSFTMTPFNQAGALVHIYKDGSVQLNHGGTEMGQGLFVKVAQVVAEELQIDIERVRLTATNTGKVPNTSATAASSGSDLNGMAAQAAARELKGRLVAFLCDSLRLTPEQVTFHRNRVRAGEHELTFAELANAAYLARVSLSATGYYKTPKIHWDRATGRGRPFFYFAYGAAVSEVTVDTLTGEYRVDRVDILHDVGRSLNPAIDLGQIEGGFVQGMGWLTTEELWWDGKGVLRTHAPSTYKIPACSDRPPVFNVRLLDDAPNREETIYRSKAVGEPPLMLAISVLHALSDAVASVADYKHCPRLDTPATPERVLAAVERLRERAAVPAVATA